MILVIIVTYNAQDCIDQCIRSLLASTAPVEIVVIDNGSVDGTVDKLSKDFPEVEVVAAGENLGFGKANNIGLRLGIKRDADFCFLLNQDAWVQENTIEELIDVSRKNSGYGILSPVHLAEAAESVDKTFTSYISGHLCPGLIADLFLKRRMKGVYEVNFVNAAMWLVTKACIQAVGGFDPLFVHYGEDDDYVWRARYHGFKVGICPHCYGVHERPQTVTDLRPFFRTYGAKLAQFKRLDQALPGRSYFLGAWVVAAVRSLVFQSNKNESRVWRSLIHNYSLLNEHRELCKRKAQTFLNDK